LLVRRQGARGQCNDDRDVARKDAVDPDDLDETDPEIGTAQKFNDVTPLS
jgi:hypothetical protein